MYLKSNFLETDLTTNQNYQIFKNQLTNAGKKIHIFVEPKGDKIIDEINDFIRKLELTANKESTVKKNFTFLIKVFFKVNINLFVGFSLA